MDKTEHEAEVNMKVDLKIPDYKNYRKNMQHWIYNETNLIMKGASIIHQNSVWLSFLSYLYKRYVLN